MSIRFVGHIKIVRRGWEWYDSK